MMYWQQITLKAPAPLAETIESCLDTLDALAITIEDAMDNPLYEPAPGTTPLWPELVIKALFDDTIDIHQKKKALATLLSEELKNNVDQNTILASIRDEKIKDENWIQKTRDQFKPMQFGTRLFVVPSWCDIPNEAKDHTIVSLDPGLAFGTGTHATTSLCLQWLEGHSLKNKFVIDYGTGSGILAIAALKLGAKHVFAIDNDPQALTSTDQNAKLNQISNSVLDIQSDQTFFESQKKTIADIVISNLLLEPILKLIPNFNSWLKPQGHLVLSGILDHQVKQAECFLKDQFELKEVIVQEGWARIWAQLSN